MARISYVKHTPKHRAAVASSGPRVSLVKPTHRKPAARPADVLVAA